MRRLGEGFNLARVNQASLIDEPARRAERGKSGHGPCHRGQMGGRDGRNRRAGIVRVPGYFSIPNRQGHVLRGARLATCLTVVPDRLRFPCRLPSTQVLPARLYQLSTYARTDGKL